MKMPEKTMLNQNSVLKRMSMGVPQPVRGFLKKCYCRLASISNRVRFIHRGNLVDIGCHFRFTRTDPYEIQIGSKTAIDDFNVWSCKKGDIITGEDCWFGLHNIIIGPVEMGDLVRTGPHVTILGPRHLVYGYARQSDRKTQIGNNVRISAGAIILFGVCVGNNAVIGPGAVVTKDVPENAYVAGNPARNLTKVAHLNTMTVPSA